MPQYYINIILKMQQLNWNSMVVYVEPHFQSQCFFFPSLQSPVPSSPYPFFYQCKLPCQQQKVVASWYFQQIPNTTNNQGQISQTRDKNQVFQDSEDKFEAKNAQYENVDKDRNLVSNSLKVFRKYAYDSISFQDSAIRQIIRKYGLNYSAEEFIKDLDKKIPKQKNYLGIKFLKSLLTKKQIESNFSIVFRVALRYYYKKQLYPTVLTSKKILAEAKKKQIVGVHKFHDFI